MPRETRAAQGAVRSGDRFIELVPIGIIATRHSAIVAETHIGNPNRIFLDLQLCYTDVDMVSASSIFETPVGLLLARACEGQLVQLSFYHRASESDSCDGSVDTANAKLLHAVKVQIGEYFTRTRTQFDLPLNLQGPAFHCRVWAALRAIPYGQTVSYGQLAAALGDPESARAVGTANGANPIAIIVPCHRVIGADGNLVGYGGGLDRKRILLDLESQSARLALWG